MSTWIWETIQEEFEDTKGVIRIRIIEEEQTTQWLKDRRTDNTMAKRQKYRQHNGQKKIDKRNNNDLQNIHIKLNTTLHYTWAAQI